MKTYLKSFEVASRAFEADYMRRQRRTCYTSYYPFNVFEARNFKPFEFEPITIFYGKAKPWNELENARLYFISCYIGGQTGSGQELKVSLRKNKYQVQYMSLI